MDDMVGWVADVCEGCACTPLEILENDRTLVVCYEPSSLPYAELFVTLLGDGTFSAVPFANGWRRFSVEYDWGSADDDRRLALEKGMREHEVDAAQDELRSVGRFLESELNARLGEERR